MFFIKKKKKVTVARQVGRKASQSAEEDQGPEPGDPGDVDCPVRRRRRRREERSLSFGGSQNSE